MFWACSVSGGKSFDLKSSADVGELLHISSAVLHSLSSEGQVTLFVTQGSEKFPVAHLDKSRPMVSLDLYFEVAKGGLFSIIGKGEVSILGYFEPGEDELVSKGEMIEAESESEEDSEDLPISKQKDAKEESDDSEDEDSDEEEEESGAAVFGSLKEEGYDDDDNVDEEKKAAMIIVISKLKT